MYVVHSFVELNYNTKQIEIVLFFFFKNQDFKDHCKVPVFRTFPLNVTHGLMKERLGSLWESFEI